MRKTAFAFAAALALATTLSAPAARANGSATGACISISVEGFPDTAAPGESISGTLTVVTFDDGTPGRLSIQMSGIVQSPFGQAIFEHRFMQLRPGRTRVVPLELHIDEHTPPGPVTFYLMVTCRDDGLRIGHTVSITDK